MAKQIGRPKAKLDLNEVERESLKRFARRSKTARALALRARIILKCASGMDSLDVADELATSQQTVCKWRQRFLRDRVAGLLDEPRTGAPRKIGDSKVEKIIDMTLNRKPENATHWSTRQLASKVGVSATKIGEIWRAFGLQPHRSESFSLSRDPQFVEKVRDIVGLYMSPPENALVLCVDEKSQIQALDRTQPLLPMTQGTAERRTCAYERHGTTSLFAALNVATGHVIGKCFRRHRTKEFLRFLKIVDAETPPDLDLHLILDNYATHKSPPVKRWLLKHPRFHLHFIPTSSSWLNLVESWFALLSRRKLARGVHRSTRALEQDIRSFIAAHDDNPRPYVWTKTADAILKNLTRYCTEVVAHD